MEGMSSYGNRSSGELPRRLSAGYPVGVKGTHESSSSPESSLSPSSAALRLPLRFARSPCWWAGRNGVPANGSAFGFLARVRLRDDSDGMSCGVEARGEGEGGVEAWTEGEGRGGNSLIASSISHPRDSPIRGSKLMSHS